mgnify:CR=1 FL=1
MVTILDKMPSLNYDLASAEIKTLKVGKKDDSYTRIYLSAATVYPETPSYLRQRFATHVQQVLAIINPQLSYKIIDAESSLFVLGCSLVFDQELERPTRKVIAQVSVSSGNDRSRAVIIESAQLNGFLETYKSILKRDLVRE